MSREITILYRGPLSSCNYDCSYCPFAKRHETAAQLEVDRVALDRFAAWARTFTGGSLKLFFTPWGEALTRPWYQQTIPQLLQLPHVQKVAVQTNLSWAQDWLSECVGEHETIVPLSRLGLWCTYHPTQTTRDHFVKQINGLRARGVRHSAGMVAMPEHFDEIEELRTALPSSTYLWLNAFDVGGGRKYDYTDEQLDRLLAIDPHFLTNTMDHPSLGRACAAGQSVFSVNGDGDVRRCHFVDERLGNLYDEGFSLPEAEQTCPRPTCGCHIGYVHMPSLKLQPIYEEGLLERVPLGYSGR